MIRLSAAALLFFAAVLKYLDLALSILPPYASKSHLTFLILQIEFELFWCVWLLAGIYPRFTRLATSSLFAIFGCFSAYHGAQGDESCGCLGVVRVNPWLMSTLDLILAAAFISLRATPEHVETKGGLPWSRHTAALVIWGILGVPVIFFSSGRRFSTPLGDGQIPGEVNVVVIDPRQWVGKQFPLYNHIPVDAGKLFARGRWHLLFVRPGCPYCEETVRQLISIATLGSNADKAHWVIVELPSDSSNPAAHTKLQHDKFRLLHLDRTKTWIANVPFTVILVNGVIEDMAHGLAVK